MTVPTDPAERLSEAPSPALQSALDAAKDSARTAAYAPETLRAYAHDWQAFCHWCDEHGTSSLPAAPPVVAAWLHSLAPRFSRSALNRRLAAIGYQHRMRGLEWSSGHAAIRTTLRAAGRVYGAPQKQAAALTSQEVRKLVAPEHSKTVEALADLRDRALLLIGFAGALRRSELVALTTETVRIVATGLKLHIARSKTDPEHRGEEIFLPRGKHRETCPVLALERWLKKAEIMDGPLFRSINRWEQVGRDALHPDAVRQILLRRARVAGLKVPSGERLSPHGLRAGFVTEAFRANARDEQIMAHTRHRDLSSMRRYVRRARLDLDSPAHLLDL
ncbi:MULTISPECIES: site-specific integrase [Gluconobacter]|nr:MULTISPECIES: site-specific integrase [Gluconobacter]MBS1020338.1 tyrosine-type recombinase/integrase [Gluconobacter cerinus]MBS1036095.1 tyrosine-type recombinase/integrase [Gluconobacter cerinus]MBS1069629.1 tyrosine-type recombinase/integrase [Gluconobacter cerinus]MCW2267142.1 site-specific recombinase XerD [Gluconobacter cerinus]